MDSKLTVHQVFHPKVKDPGFMPTLITRVANGGSLIELCKEIDVLPSEAFAYVYGDPDRARAYKDVLASRSEWFVQRLIDELRSLALVNPAGLFNADGTLKPIDQIPAELTACIASIEVKETFDYVDGEKVFTGYLKTVKLNDKLKAIEMIGKNMKMFVDELRVTGNVEVRHTVDKVDLDERIKQLRGRGTAVTASVAPVAPVAPRETIQDAVIIEKEDTAPAQDDI